MATKLIRATLFAFLFAQAMFPLAVPQKGIAVERVTANGLMSSFNSGGGDLLASAAGLAAASRWVEAQILVSPTATIQPMTSVITSTPRADGSVYHPVEFGQTLSSIAQAYGLTVAALQKLNNLGSSETIFMGQKLLIRGAAAPTAVPTITPTPLQPTRTPTKTRTPTPLPSATPLPTETPTPTPQPLLPDLATLDSRTIGEVIVGVSAVGLLLVVILLFIRKKPS